MGYGGSSLKLMLELKKRGLLDGLDSVIELGSQDISRLKDGRLLKRLLGGFEVRNVDGAVREFLDIQKRDGQVGAKWFYEKIGFKEYSCIDTDGRHDALVFDLNLDIRKAYNFSRQYDIVTNHGTTEHVFDVAASFKNVHNLCRPGGLMIHGLPFQGYMYHSFYNFQPNFYRDLCADNNYKTLGCFINLSPAPNRLYEIHPKCARHLTFTDAVLFYVLRKENDDEFVCPFEGSYRATSQLHKDEKVKSGADDDRHMTLEKKLELLKVIFISIGLSTWANILRYMKLFSSVFLARILMREIKKAILAVPTLFIVLIARIISPLVLIRFICLPTDRIGHLAANTEMYLCHREKESRGRRPIDIFYCRTQICNRQLVKMCKRLLFVTPYASTLNYVNRLFPGWQKHTLIRLLSDRDTNGFYASMAPHLSFTKDEVRRGEEGLKRIGIANGAPFICFHSRDSAYMDKVQPETNWYRDNYEDVNVDNYLLAAEELTRRGYFVIRMGAVVNKPLNTRNPMIIDYAVNGREDFLDIFLCANCRFFLASASGLSSVPLIFRKPIAWSNFIPLEYVPSWDTKGILILKKLRRRSDGRIMSFREIIGLKASKFLFTEEYDKFGIEVIENTPEEIAALAVEIDERLKGRWQPADEDEELQRRFWDIIPSSNLHGKIGLRIGAEFLRKNGELLK